MSQYSVFFFFFFFFLKLLLFLWYPALNLILCLFFPKSGVDLYRESTPGGPVLFLGGSGHPQALLLTRLIRIRDALFVLFQKALQEGLQDIFKTRCASGLGSYITQHKSHAGVGEQSDMKKAGQTTTKNKQQSTQIICSFNLSYCLV